MRQVVLDTETTGLDPKEGHRLIEIGCVELNNREFTGRVWHHYLNPEREIDADAIRIHGITNEFVADKPVFSSLAVEFLDFVRGAELVIHNAAFDIGFLNAELMQLNRQLGQMADYCTVLDTLMLARRQRPGQRNNLDALCKAYGVDNSHRKFHGALMDAEILADVYLAMTGGQTSLVVEDEPQPDNEQPEQHEVLLQAGEQLWELPQISLSPEEELKHQHCLKAIEKSSGGNCLFLKLDAATNP